MKTHRVKFNYILPHFSMLRSTRLLQHHVPGRKLIRVIGNTEKYLNLFQGLLTQDVNLFDKHRTSLYSHLLDDKGRVLTDLILYKPNETDFMLIETDEALQERLVIQVLAFNALPIPFSNKIAVLPLDFILWLPLFDRHEGLIFP